MRYGLVPQLQTWGPRLNPWGPAGGGIQAESAGVTRTHPADCAADPTAKTPAKHPAALPSEACPGGQAAGSRLLGRGVGNSPGYHQPAREPPAVSVTARVGPWSAAAAVTLQLTAEERKGVGLARVTLQSCRLRTHLSREQAGLGKGRKRGVVGGGSWREEVTEGPWGRAWASGCQRLGGPWTLVLRCDLKTVPGCTSLSWGPRGPHIPLCAGAGQGAGRSLRLCL